MHESRQITPLPADWRVTEAHRAQSCETACGFGRPLEPGASVGDYVILSPEARGAGYRARHSRTGRIVALAVWPCAPPSWVTVLAALRGPGLVQVLDFGAFGEGGSFAATEPVAGLPLAEFIAREGQLAALDALEIAAAVARALAALADAGHHARTVDAGNVIVDARERPFAVTLVDLDLRGGGDAGEALAGLTYRLLSGRLPFQDRTAAGAAAALGPGARVGRFRIIERLGEGGMGIVFSAYDPDLDRRVALKVLRADSAADGSATAGRERLLREARALARLRHPNVISVHEVGSAGDCVYLAMELADGGTIAQWLRETRPWRD